MRIPSGVTDQYIYFVAVDATDLKTRETGLSSFTVYRSRNGAAASAMTTPTVNETDGVNMPGVYELLLDEDMSIAAGNDSEEMIFHITHAGMNPVDRVIELYRPKITAGNTLDVTATGAAGIDWGNVENPTTSVDLSGTDIQLCDTVTTNTDMRGTDSALLAASAPTNFGDLAITVTTGQVTVGTNNDKTGYSISGSITTLDGLNDLSAAEVNAEVDTALTDYDAPTNTEMTAAFTEIKGATWSASTDTLEHIRNKQTDIETDTQDIQTQIGTAGAGLTDLGAMSTAMKAEINTEVADVLKVDTISEMAQQQPPSTPTFEEAVMYLYMRLRNKIDVTATTKEFHNDAGTVIWKKTLSDDGTTYSEAKGATGP